MELMMMKALKRHLSPLTFASWLNVYVQVAYVNDTGEVPVPQYPQQVFAQTTELLDLRVLDVDCLEFPYGVLTASALYHFSSLELMQVSGYQWCDIEKCVRWMVPFTMVIREMGSSKLKRFRGVPMEDSHNIQTHTSSLDLLDKAQAKKAILSEQNRISPPPSGVLTPPHSSKKQAVSRRQNDQTCHRLQRQWCGSSCLELLVLPWRSGAPADAVLYGEHLFRSSRGLRGQKCFY